jgi:hypothetical protein
LDPQIEYGLKPAALALAGTNRMITKSNDRNDKQYFFIVDPDKEKKPGCPGLSGRD